MSQVLSATRTASSTATSTSTALPPEYKQHQTRVGLFVTREYERARERCKAKVDSIASDYRSKNRRFRDIAFDIEGRDQRMYCLHGPDVDINSPKFKPYATMRIPQIFEDPQFYIQGAKYTDVAQGALGDCWFMSAIAAVGTKDGIIEKICVARDEKVGIYGFIFCRDGEWHDVIIDDLLFTVTPSWEGLDDMQKSLYHKDRALYEKVGRKGGKTLYFARSAQENETWLPLIEKAYAKFHGDYQSLEGGCMNEGVEDLTGGISEALYCKDILNTDLFWEKDLKRADEDLLFNCGVMSPQGVVMADDEVQGVLMDHAYTVIKAIEFRGKRFLKIRNPWGDYEWTGRWSDGSKEWNGEWLDALDALNHRFGDDGVFIMEYCDFLETFSYLDRTQLFDDTWVQSSHWMNVNSRPLPAAWQYGDVSFTFSLPEKSETVLVLSQSDTRFYLDISSAARWSMDFKLFKVGEKELIGSSAYSTTLTRRSATLTVDLSSGDYVVHVRLNRTVGTRQANLMSENMASWDVKKMSRVWSQAAEGKSISVNFDHQKWVNQLVVPLDVFAGQDLLKLHINNQDKGSEERQALKSKFDAAKSIVPGLTSGLPAKTTTASSSLAKLALGDDLVHEGITCDKCMNGKPIVGNRWKCTICDNYDLCNPCYLAKAHGHVMWLIPKSEDTPVAPEPVHIAWCDGCKNGELIVGIRWKCQICLDYDLCDSCHTAQVHKQHVMEVVPPATNPSPEVTGPTHAGIACNACANARNIVGNRWKCMSCENYNICDTCHMTNAHKHQMLKIAHPTDAISVESAVFKDDTNSVVLGFRVYSKSNAPVQIAGQLSNLQGFRWKKYNK